MNGSVRLPHRHGGAEETDRGQVQCPLCGHPHFYVLFEGDFRVLLCRACALAFLSDSRRDLDEYYSHHYEYGLEDQGASHDRVVRWVLRHRPPNVCPKLLEIGCGHGHLLVRLRRCGFRVSGIEPGRRAAESARNAYGLKVACLTLERLAGAPKDERYDAVLLIQTLEHLVDPLGALSIVRELMTSSGLLFVEVPHYFSPTGLYRFRVDGRYVPSPNHLFVYSAETLGALLRRAGFDVVDCSRTLTDLRVVARRSADMHAPRSPPGPAGAYWKARAFHQVTPLLLRAVDVAKRVRQGVRRLGVKGRSP